MRVDTFLYDALTIASIISNTKQAPLMRNHEKLLGLVV